MSILSIILIAIGLSMDAFAVSMSIGINTKEENKLKMALKSGIFFGGFQAIMPLIGWLLGVKFAYYIEKIDHWVAFLLLAFIGGKMLYEAFHNEEENDIKEYSNKEFFILAIATSIDALAVGVSFALLSVNIVYAVSIIGVTTMILSIVAVFIGKVLGSVFKSKAEILGGLILVGIGIKILVEHLVS